MTGPEVQCFPVNQIRQQQARQSVFRDQCISQVCLPSRYLAHDDRFSSTHRKCIPKTLYVDNGLQQLFYTRSYLIYVFFQRVLQFRLL